jgi:truncated hemoglobin YjbI
MRSKPYCHYIPDRQMEMFRDISKQSELNVSELMRRFYDFCLQQHNLNQILPSMSGTIKVGK